MTPLKKEEGSRTDKGGSDYAYNQRRRQEYKASMAAEASRLLREHGYDSFFQGDVETLEMWMTWG